MLRFERDSDVNKSVYYAWEEKQSMVSLFLGFDVTGKGGSEYCQWSFIGDSVADGSGDL